MAYLLKASKINFGLSIRDLRVMAYDFAVKEKIKFPAAWNEAGLAGKDWYYSFMRRHPNLSIRTPEQISMSRVKAFNKESVGNFFEMLGSVYEQNSYDPDRIWNMNKKLYYKIYA